MLRSLATSQFAAQALAWLLTYAIHSTLLLGLAWGVSRRLGERRLEVQEMIWRYALVGALVTASLQLAMGALGPAPLGGRWVLASTSGVLGSRGFHASQGRRGWSLAELAAPSGDQVSGAVPAAHSGERASAEVPAARSADSASAAAPAAPPVMLIAAESGAAQPVNPRPASPGPAGLVGMAAAAQPPAAPRLVSWRWSALPPGLPVIAWLACSLLLSIIYLRSYLMLRRRLRYRPQVVGGGALNRLTAMVRAAGIARPVRLTCTWRLRVPVALGGRTAEVCVPPRALFELSEEQQDALLAHELGHLVRRDPAWLVIGQLMVSLFFFQPLNWVARRRLRELSELLSDQWAVDRTGQPLSLAGCLAEVAGWSLGQPRHSVQLPVPGIAGRPSHLSQRIRRLLDGPLPAAGSRPTRRAALLLLGTALLAVTVAAPGIAARSLPDGAAAGAADRAPAVTQTVASEEAARQPSAPSEVPPPSSAVDPASSPDPEETMGPATPEPSAMAATTAPVVAGGVVAAGAGVEPAPGAATGGEAEEEAEARPLAPPARGGHTDRGGEPRPSSPSPAASDLQAESRRLAAAAAQLARLDKVTTLSQEQLAQMSATVERIGREMDVRLRQQLADLDRRIAAARGGATPPTGPPSHDMDRLGAELSGVTAQLQPSARDLARMEVALRQLDTAPGPPGLSPEEREHLEAELHHLSADLPRLLSQDIPHLDLALHEIAIEMPKLSDADLAHLRSQLKQLPAELPHLSAVDRVRLQEALDKLQMELPRLTDRSLEKIRIQLGHLPAQLSDLSAVDRVRLQAALDKLQIDLPRLADLDHVRIALQQLPTDLPHLSHQDMAHLEAGLDQLAARPPHLSDSDLKKIQQQVDRALQHLPKDLSPADRERLRAEIHRAIDQAKAAVAQALPPAERKKIVADALRQAEHSRREALDSLQLEHEELTRQLEQQREQLETMRREIREQADALRDLARRESQAHRTQGVPPPPALGGATPPPAAPAPSTPPPPRR